MEIKLKNLILECPGILKELSKKGESEIGFKNNEKANATFDGDYFTYQEDANLGNSINIYNVKLKCNEKNPYEAELIPTKNKEGVLIEYNYPDPDAPSITIEKTIGDTTDTYSHDFEVTLNPDHLILGKVQEYPKGCKNND